MKIAAHTALALLSLLLWAPGCGDDELTEVLVVVDTTMAVPERIDRIEFSVESDGQVQSEDGRLSENRPLTLAVVHRGGPLGPVRVTVHSPELGLEREARFHFVRGEVRTLTIHLVEACLRQTCPAGDTCGNDGSCRPIDVAEGELAPWTGAPPALDGATPGDGGVVPDGPVSDGGGPDGCVPADEVCNGADDDCDGIIDDDFDLVSSVDRCGACDHACPAGESCVARACDSDFVAVAAGAGHSCAVDDLGAVWCWGDDGKGQLGSDATDGGFTPVRVMGLPEGDPVRRLGAGQDHSCAVLASGEVWCWGDDGQGQLGDGDASAGPGPVSVTLPDAAVDIAAATDHACAVLADGTAHCWGKGANGRLGDGTATDRNAPVAAAGLTEAIGISAGDLHTCAVRSDGTVWCWGSNADERLGVAGIADSDVPIAVDGVTDVVSVAAGGAFTCALRSDRTVRCWGRNSTGQLGSGDTSGGEVPRAVVDPDDVAAEQLMRAIWLDAGNEHACAVLEDGRMACWGSDELGQLGRGRVGSRSVSPVYVHGRPDGGAARHLTAVVRVAAGGAHTCVHLADDAVLCWGANALGQAGVMESAAESAPRWVLDPTP